MTPAASPAPKPAERTSAEVLARFVGQVLAARPTARHMVSRVLLEFAIASANAGRN